MKEISNIQITLKTGDNGECPFCRGKGYFCIKPEETSFDDHGFRMYPSTTVGCTFCHGTGKVKEHYQKELYPAEKDSWSYLNSLS